MEAIITVTADRTQQAAETIGRAWNSVIQRINKISAGKDVSDTGMALNDVDKVLTKVGLSLKDENGIIRETADVLDEVAAKWNTWNKNQQNQVATAIAGTNQANIFRATMASYNEVLNATNIAQEANGSSMERMSIYTESLTAKINKFKTTWTELVNNLDLQNIIGDIVDLGTKILEILDFLLNKIPVLSTLLKGVLTVQGANIFFGAVYKSLNLIIGENGLQGLLSGLITLESVFGKVTDASGETVTGLNAIRVAMISLSSGAKIAMGAVGALIAILTAAYYVWDNFISVEGRLENANKKLSESTQEVDETKSKIDELLTEKQELESVSTDELTTAEKNRLEIINDQLDTYNEILKTKQKIAEEDQKQVDSLEYEQIEGNYTGKNSLSYNRNNAQNAVQNTQPLIASDNMSFSSNLAKQEQLIKMQEKLQNGEEQYGYSLEGVNNLIEQNNQILQEQILTLQEDKVMLEENGQTGTEEYKNLCEQIEVYKALMNPADWEDNTIQNLVDFDSIVDEINTGGKEAADAIAQTARDVATEIQNDQALKSAAEVAFNIDLSTIDGYNQLVKILTEDIPKGYQNSENAANEFGTTANNVFTQYLDISENLTEAQTTLNTALGEMQYNGQLSIATVRDLIAAYPELSNHISIQNGQLKIEAEYLQKVWEAQKETQKKTIESQISQTKTVIENVKTRIKAYTEEASALQAMASAGDTTAQRVQYLEEVMASSPKNSQKYVNAAREYGSIITRQNTQLTGLNATLARLQESYDALDSLGGLTPTAPKGTSGSSGSRGSGGTQTDPAKEAYELQKSEIEVVKDQLELQKDILESKKEQIQQQKDGIELEKDQIDLLKDQAEQQLELVQNAEESIDNIIEMIEKMTKQDYDNLKTNLEGIKTFLGDFQDALSDLEDTYQDLVEDAKDKLQAEKEAADNQKELEEKARSIAEIQAQLQEIAYDNSSDAMAQRMELTAQLNDAQREMEDTAQDQAYDDAMDALDKTKDEVSDVFDQVNSILSASQDAIQTYIDFISNTLQQDGNLYQMALLQFNDTGEGAREELYNRLVEWNRKYGDSIDQTVTSAWNDATKAVEDYKDAADSSDLGTVRNYLASQDKSLSDQINVYEQSINQFDNTIKQLDIDMQGVDNQVQELENVIDRVSMALSQLDINYNMNANATDADAQGTGTGNQYAWDLIRTLLAQSGVDTSALPQTYDELVSSLEAGKNTVDGFTESAEQATQSVDAMSSAETSASTSTDTMGQSAQNAATSTDALSTSADVAASALGGVATGGTGASGNGKNLLNFLFGSDPLAGFGNFAASLVSKYLPILLRAGINKIITNHDGTNYVRKDNSWLDQMLGLGSDETARILKVGEAVIPDYINSASGNRTDTPFSGSLINSPDTSMIKSNGNSSLTINMGDLDINGIDSALLRSELEHIKQESANKVYSTLNRYIKVGGYRNVKNRYN